MLSVVMLNVAMLSVAMLNVIMLIGIVHLKLSLDIQLILPN